MSEHIYIVETRPGSKALTDFSLAHILTDKDDAMAKAVELTVRHTERWGEPPWEIHSPTSHVWMWELHAVRMYEHRLGDEVAPTSWTGERN